jgi:AraC family transcriptional regulator, arabinose operon regulatory protein
MSLGTAQLKAGPRLRAVSKGLPGGIGMSAHPETQQAMVAKFTTAVSGPSLGSGVTKRTPTTEVQLALPASLLDRRVMAVLNRMEENLGAAISFEGLATSVNISPSRLRHLFKQQTGNTPLRQLKLMRLLRARELLQDSFLSLKQVMNLVGMTDISHFVKDYKRVHGETPGRTRRTCRADQAHE